jgi:hypothetical protein
MDATIEASSAALYITASAVIEIPRERTKE